MNKPIVKNLILIGIPTLISAIGIIMNQPFLSGFNNLFIYITIGLLIGFIIFVIYYAKMDKNEQSKYEELSNENLKLLKEIEELKIAITSITTVLNTNNSIVTSFVSIIEPWTANINKIANDIELRGKANEKDWDYEKICTDICIGCKNAIRQFNIDSNGTDISVGFIKYYSKNNNESVKMIAHSSPQTAKPDIFDVEELLIDCNYQYARLIKSKTRDIFVLENNEKIIQRFYR